MPAAMMKMRLVSKLPGAEGPGAHSTKHHSNGQFTFETQRPGV